MRVRAVFCILAFGAAAVAAPAYAGFEFTPAPQQAAPASQPPAEQPMPIVPAPAVVAEPLMPPPQTDPVIAQGSVSRDTTYAALDASMAGLDRLPPPAQPVPQSGLVINPYPLQQSAQTMPEPMPQTSTPPLPAPSSVICNEAPAPQNAFPEAIGFGRDLPLALALSQVVPPDYSYNFASNVDTGAQVSWQGGRPWNQVLNDMLATSGLRANIQGKQVTIESARS
jgi:hypothetical protein